MPKKPRKIGYAGKVDRRTPSTHKWYDEAATITPKMMKRALIGQGPNRKYGAVLNHGKVAEPSVPCQHIADYYTSRWKEGPNIAFNLLRLGYEEWSLGMVSPWNNLFGPRRLPFLKESLS